MALLEELNEGSFEGQVFLVKSATTIGGRKQVLHEYPNSDKQKIEDLGFKPRNFKMTAIITGPNARDPRPYLQKRNGLLEALERGGVGTLSHPFFNSSLQVVARNYTLIENVNELERATIELEFDASARFTDPLPQSPSLSEIESAKEATLASVNDSVAGEFEVSTIQNVEAANTLLTGFSGAVDSITNTFNKLAEPSNVLNAQLSQFNSEIGDLIRAPSELADSMTNIVNTTQSLYQNINTAISTYTRFFSFGDDDEPVPPTTPNRAQRNNNNKVINQATQASYLALTYRFAAENEYTTVNEIEEIQDVMENQFQKLKENDVDEGIFQNLANLRTLTNKWLEDARLNAAQIVTVNEKEQPLSVMAYKYYGDADNFNELVDNLVDLNRPKANNLTFLSGDVEVLTQ